MSKTSDFKISKLYYDEESKDRDSYILIADYDKREVTTNCGDFYYDLSIDFDDFIKFAKHIEEQDKILNRGNK